MVKAGCPPCGIVLDPFAGASTTLLVAKKLGLRYLGIDLNPDYVAMGETRLRKIGEPLFAPEPKVIPNKELTGNNPLV
jgi:DNA modification methylase